MYLGTYIKEIFLFCYLQKFVNDKEECKKIREINAKLEVELKEARELEKSHRYHLLSSREMIGNLQETVSQLVHLKRDLKKMKEEIMSRDSTILIMEKVSTYLFGNIQFIFQLWDIWNIGHPSPDISRTRLARP